MEFKDMSNGHSNEQWRATVTFTRPATVTDEQRAALVGAVPGYGVAVEDEQTMRLAMTVEASTLRRASDTAARIAAGAYAEAFGRPGEMVELRVLTDAAHLRELEQPDELDLVGIAEAADILGVSRQRVPKIAEAHPDDFPEPVARLAMGPVYTRDSIEAFNQRWDRKRTGRPKKERAEHPAVI